jgi:hypothetical protein
MTLTDRTARIAELAQGRAAASEQLDPAELIELDPDTAALYIDSLDVALANTTIALVEAVAQRDRARATAVALEQEIAFTPAGIIADVIAERRAQDAKWGEQNHPDGTGTTPLDAGLADHYRDRCQQAFADGVGTWHDVLLEEVYEALAEHEPGPLRAELIQVAAVTLAWIAAIDRRDPA